MKRAVYFFCTNSDIDPVARNVFNAVSEMYPLCKTDILIDAQPVLSLTDEMGNEFYFVRTNKVVCHDYRRYLPTMNQYFADFDFSGLITWHEGENAPDRILSVHTTGDVNSGYFGNANSHCMHNLLWVLEANRTVGDLDDFRITTEGTHWSGMVYNGGSPYLITEFPVPLVDIEIGSTHESWTNERAAEVIAKSLTGVFQDTGKIIKNILCVGGVHFEPSFSQAVFASWDEYAFGISHILPNHWLVTGQYEGDQGLIRYRKCIESICDGIEGIVHHDNLKGVYKQQLRLLGTELKIPVFKHQWLSRPREIPWSD